MSDYYDPIVDDEAGSRRSADEGGDYDDRAEMHDDDVRSEERFG